MLKGIVGIPLKTTFKEELHSYEIKIDGANGTSLDAIFLLRE